MVDLSTIVRGSTPHVLLNGALVDTDAEALSNSPLIRSAPHSRLSMAISLIKDTVSGDILGVRAAVLDFYFQKS
jgi:hypothetical protein